MCRIKNIKSIFCHIPVYETPCAVIQEDDRTGKQRPDYGVVHHQRKGKLQLHHPAQDNWRIHAYYYSKKIGHHYQQYTTPFVVCSQTCCQPCCQQYEKPA